MCLKQQKQSSFLQIKFCRYYEKGEIKNFENIECEWPLFYLYMIIDGVFKSLPEQVTEYEELLKARIVLDQYGGKKKTHMNELKLCYYVFFVIIDPVVPRCFYVPEESIDREQNYPNTGPRKPCEEAGLFLWNQAMFVLAQLLTGGLLHMNELDPIRRYLPSYNRPRKGGRYSAFQVGFCWFFYLGLEADLLLFHASAGKTVHCK